MELLTLVAQTVLVGLLAGWLVIGAYENIRAPEVNLALVRDVFSMAAIAEEMPGVYELVKRNRVTSEALQTGLFRLIVAFETLVAAGLVLGTAMLGLAVFGAVDVSYAQLFAGWAVLGFHPDLGFVSRRRQLVPLLGVAQKHAAHPLLHDVLGHSDFGMAGVRWQV
jgi:predicted small integral membrane protein